MFNRRREAGSLLVGTEWRTSSIGAEVDSGSPINFFMSIVEGRSVDEREKGKGRRGDGRGEGRGEGKGERKGEGTGEGIGEGIVEGIGEE